MLSVLHVCSDFWPSTGGIQQFVRDLATRSVTAGMRVGVVCFNRVKGFPGTLPAHDMLEGVAVRRIAFLDLKYYKPAVIPLALIKAHDVVHVHGIGAPLDYIALTKDNHTRPIVVSTHGGIFHTTTLSGLKSIYFHGVVPLVMRRVDTVVACSHSDAVRFAPVARQVRLLENAIDTAPLLALSLAAKQAARCLYVGRLADNKGIDLLLRAAAAARGLGASFTLRLVGPDVDNRRNVYGALAADLGIADRVAFVGEVEPAALLREYEQAEIFLSASRYEGFGLTAIEAKAAGCRLLLHRNEAFRRNFAADTNATLVDFNDANMAGKALLELLRSEPDSTLQQARLTTQAYSWDQKITEWSALYREIARSGLAMATRVGTAG